MSITEKTTTAIHKQLAIFAADCPKREKGNHSAGVRARKALQEIKRIAGDARKEIHDLPYADAKEGAEAKEAGPETAAAEEDAA